MKHCFDVVTIDDYTFLDFGPIVVNAKDVVSVAQNDSNIVVEVVSENYRWTYTVGPVGDLTKTKESA